MSESLSIDGFGPLPVRRPASAAELGDLVREAVATARGVYPVGGRTHLGLGLPPAKPGVAVDTTGLAAVIDYPARDMTVTVGAGVTVGTLRDALAAENQWLPVDVPEPDAATIGGAIATNASGPRRYGYGTLRDYVIGVSFVTDEGVEVKGGGRVVKNVAGYDLMKLHTGALGTLGVVTQVTLKVKPRPEESAAVVFGCGEANVGPLLDLLHASKSRPAVAELFNAAAWRAAGGNPPVSGDWVIAAGFEEKRVTVGWQVATLLAELKTTTARDVSEVRGDDAARIWSAATALQTRSGAAFTWKATLRPSGTAGLATAVGAGPGVLICAEALNGIVWVHADAPLTLPESDAQWTVRRCPPEWKARLPVWGRPRGDWELMRQVKRTLDPNNVFNPGRLFAEV